VAALGQFCLISKQGSGERSIRSSSRFEMLQIACSGRRSINSSITSKAPDLACSPNHVKIISGNIGATPE
jgi:hypothetical protein